MFCVSTFDHLRSMTPKDRLTHQFSMSGIGSKPAKVSKLTVQLAPKFATKSARTPSKVKVGTPAKVTSSVVESPSAKDVLIRQNWNKMDSLWKRGWRHDQIAAALSGSGVKDELGRPISKRTVKVWMDVGEYKMRMPRIRWQRA